LYYQFSYKFYDYYYYYCLFLRLCRIFTIICLKQTMFIGYIVLRLFYSCNLYSMHVMLSATINLCISIFRISCVVPSTAVLCSSLNSCFRGVLLRYFLNCFDLDTFAPVVTGMLFWLMLKLLIVHLKIRN